MKASILDLCYKMKDVLSALARNESVDILYHGKLKGTILPCQSKKKYKVAEHPFFGMEKEIDVDNLMDQLRGGRYRDF